MPKPLFLSNWSAQSRAVITQIEHGCPVSLDEGRVALTEMECKLQQIADDRYPLSANEVQEEIASVLRLVETNCFWSIQTGDSMLDEITRRDLWFESPLGKAYLAECRDEGVDPCSCDRFGHFYPLETEVRNKYGAGGSTFACLFCDHEITLGAEV